MFPDIAKSPPGAKSPWMRTTGPDYNPTHLFVLLSTRVLRSECVLDAALGPGGSALEF